MAVGRLLLAFLRFYACGAASNDDDDGWETNWKQREDFENPPPGTSFSASSSSSSWNRPSSSSCLRDQHEHALQWTYEDKICFLNEAWDAELAARLQEEEIEAALPGDPADVAPL